MDENTALILRGIQLAKGLEQNLAHNLANERDYVARITNEIIRVFTSVRERVSSPPPRIGGDSGNDGSVIPEWFRSTDDHPQCFLPQTVAVLPPVVEVRPRQSGSGGEMDASHSSRWSSSSTQRSTRRPRRDELDRYTRIVPAPQMGNLDIPPEDGYTWRKYGQKEILGSKFPRAYYRCTHSKLYNCPAKKQVQRLDENPFMFQITYRSNHICHMSATAPSALPPSIGDVTVHQPSQPPTLGSGGAVTSHWLTMDVRAIPGEGTSADPFGDMDVRRDFSHAVSVSSTSNVIAVGSGTAGPSTARYERDVGDCGGQPVVDLVDVIFNYSGSSSNNSMDLIFSSTDQKGNTSGEKEK